MHYSLLPGAIAAAHLAIASGVPFAAPPRTYSFSAIGWLDGSSLALAVDRNGSRERVERATAVQPGEAAKIHDVALYDFAAHRLYTLDLNSHICTTGEYSAPSVSGMVDPVGSAAETTSGLAGMPSQIWSREMVNGIAAKVAELPGGEGKGRSKVWVDEKYGFVLKMAVGEGTGPLSTRFEIKEIRYEPSPASRFAVPAECGAPETPRAGVASPPVKVTAVHMRVVPESYVGPCPSQVVLTGDITVSGPGVVWYRFLAGAVYRNGPAEGTIRFAAAGTRTVTLEGTIRTTPAAGQTWLIAAMEDEQGRRGPPTSSRPVDYNRTCQK